MATLDIIIVNWNAGEQLYHCLKSIIETDQNNFNLAHVIVVDNNSFDNSINEKTKELNLPLNIISNKKNRGFGAACNQGASESNADYLLFLNPDTILFKNSLSKPLAFMEVPQNKKIGITGIQLLNENNMVSPTCSKFPAPKEIFIKACGLNYLFPRIFQSHFMTAWNHMETREVDQIMGAFFLVRRSLFESLNGFDERFFVYFEDVDFSIRAQQAGWHSFYFAGAQAYHRGRGTTDQIKARRLFYSLRSRILYSCKHFGLLSTVSIVFSTVILEFITRVLLALSKGSLSQFQDILKGYTMLWDSLLSKKT